MNGTITLPIDAELAGWLTAGAATRGVKIEDFAVDTLRRVAGKPTINEVFADVQADFKVSGMTEKELQRDLEQAVTEVRTERRAKEQSNGKNVPTAIEARDGGYYFTDSRISLAAVILRFKEGLSPETIRRECFPSLPLADIYSAVTFYLNHQDLVENYLQQLWREEDELQQELLARHPDYIKTAEELRRRKSAATSK